MSDDFSSAEKRFSEHLRRIREARDVSVDAVHSETQIPRTLVESFEEGELYEHPSYNEVYLRSFIKAYSEAIGMPRDAALKGLEAALEGTYDDALLEYVSESEEEADRDEQTESASDEENNAVSAGGPSGQGGIVGPPRAVGEEDEPSIEDISSPDAHVQADDEEEKGSEEGGSPSEAAADEKTSLTAERADDPDAPEDDEESEASIQAASAAASADDEGSDSEIDPEDAREKLDEMSGPEALRSTPDETDEGTERRADNDRDSEIDEGAAPDWRGEAESDAERPEVSSSAEADSDMPAAGAGGTGIVGEPQAMGEEGTGPAERDSGGRPASARGASSTGDGLSDTKRQIYATGIGIVVVVLVLIGVGIAYFSSSKTATDSSSSSASSPPEADTTVAAAAPDTSASAEEPADTTDAVVDEEGEDRPPPADVTLGDDIDLLIYATAPVRRIRIQRDDDLRRPYWIEAEEASVFPFERRAVVRRELENVRLYVEGYRYPVATADTTDGLELTRSQLQSFVDTLRGAPASLSVSPDTIPVGGPPAESVADSSAGTDSGETTSPADTSSN